jgi:hypothetical protein
LWQLGALQEHAQLASSRLPAKKQAGRSLGLAFCQASFLFFASPVRPEAGLSEALIKAFYKPPGKGTNLYTVQKVDGRLFQLVFGPKP